jgi:AhpD family alkylhydroperoxidase
MADDVQVANRRLDASRDRGADRMARMGADAFGYKAKLRIDRGLAQLLRLRVSQLNDCTYCLNPHCEAARAAGIPRAHHAVRVSILETELHSEAERSPSTSTRRRCSRSSPSSSRERLDPDQARRGRDAGPGG